MNSNLKVLAVAAAMITATAASAAPTITTTGNNGSLVIAAYNTVSTAYYIRDTGLYLNDFLPSTVTTLSGDGAVTGNKTPNAGLTLDKTTNASFADASFGTWLGSQTQSDIRWFVSAVDSTGTGTTTNVKRFLTSSANTSETATNGNLDGYIASGNAGGIATLYAAGTNGDTVSTGSTLDTAASAWATNFGLFTSGEDSHGQLGSSISLFYFARSTGTGSTGTAATGTRFGNTTGYATVSLAANGDFSYVLAGETVAPSAVPVPAAAWLFGSGLLSFGAFVRRRTAK